MIRSKKKSLWMALPFFLLTIVPVRGRAAGLDADWVLYNGKVLTANTEDPSQFAVVQAVAIYDGKFVAVGANQDVLNLAGPTTKRIDLAGRTVLPGLIETHLHVNTQTIGHHLGGKALAQTDAPISWRNKDEILAQLKTLALGKKPGDWIVIGIRGLPPNAVDMSNASSTPSLAELDAAVPNNPLAVGGGNGGYTPAVVNSKTLAILNKSYPEGISGIVTGPDGKPTGVLKWAASMSIGELTPPPTMKKFIDSLPAFRAELEEPAARGLTTIATRVDWDTQREYAMLDQREEMPIRLAYAPEFAAYSPRSDFLFRRVYLAAGQGSPWLWMSGATTGTAEYGGSPNGAASCINGTYAKTSDVFKTWNYQPWGDHGECRFRDDDGNAAVLKNFFLNAVKNGWVVTNLHVQGDRTLDDYLTLLEGAEKQFGVKMADFRFSSDHCGWVSQQQAERAQHLGITFSCTPASLMDVAPSGLGAYAKIYDMERAADAYAPFHRLVQLGMKPSAHCEGHTDWTFTCIEMIVTRKDRTTGRVWGPQQRVDRKAALYSFTRWSSWHVWKEKYIGSIEPGKWADLVVIDKDYLTIPEDQLSDISPLLTIVGGKISYSEPGFATKFGLPTVGFQAPPDWWLRKGPKKGNYILDIP